MGSRNGRANGGGIRKRNGGHARADRDGDYDMGAIGRNGRGLGGHNNGNGPNTRGPRNRPPVTQHVRGKLIQEYIEKEIFKPRGHGNSRSRGGSGKHGGKVHGGNALQSFAITGFNQSSAASDTDGGVEKLINFLERKASTAIKESRPEGEGLIVSVDSQAGDSIARLNGFTFFGSKIGVARIEGTTGSDRRAACDSPNTISTFRDVIDRRYNDELRLLDLSDLPNDPLLNNIGIFGPNSSQARQSKFFNALMNTCDDIWSTEQEKAQAVVSISLANNGLGTVDDVKNLSHSFKAIKNLDLSNNNLATMQALSAWRFSFRSLEELILSGNQIEQGGSAYVRELVRWYPNLRLLSNTPVRSGAELKSVQTTESSVLPVLTVPILVASFRDEAGVGENFIKQFFPAYDIDRNACINAFYDAKSTFSLSINTSAPRASNDVAGWDAYIKKSRNLIKITQIGAKVSRLYTGATSICDAWKTLPSTRHPDLLTQPDKWSIECNAIPSIPDPVGESVSGVGGLIIMVHGEFAEVNLNTNQEIVTRSFDRTFILGPGMGNGGVRVACDTLILRSYGGSEAWKPMCGDLLVAHPAQSELLIQPLIPEGFGLARPGKPEETLQKEVLAVELSRTTRMTLHFASMCLVANNWSIEAAVADFAAVSHLLSPSAFVAPQGGSLIT